MVLCYDSAIVAVVMTMKGKTMQVNMIFTNKNHNTIENKLAEKLGRQPSDSELKQEVLRILRSV